MGDRTMMICHYSLSLTKEVLAAIQNLEGRTSTLAEVQSVLQSVVPLFENDDSGVENAILLAEADLEEIQFTTLQEEQVTTAIFRLDNLRAVVQTAYIESQRPVRCRYAGQS